MLVKQTPEEDSLEITPNLEKVALTPLRSILKTSQKYSPIRAAGKRNIVIREELNVVREMVSIYASDRKLPPWLRYRILDIDWNRQPLGTDDLIWLQKIDSNRIESVFSSDSYEMGKLDLRSDSNQEKPPIQDRKMLYSLKKPTYMSRSLKDPAPEPSAKPIPAPAVAEKLVFLEDAELYDPKDISMDTENFPSIEATMEEELDFLDLLADPERSKRLTKRAALQTVLRKKREVKFKDLVISEESDTLEMATVMTDPIAVYPVLPDFCEKKEELMIRGRQRHIVESWTIEEETTFVTVLNQEMLLQKTMTMYEAIADLQRAYGVSFKEIVEMLGSASKKNKDHNTFINGLLKKAKKPHFHL